MKRIDQILILCVVVLISAGLISLFSTDIHRFKLQLLHAVIGLGLMFLSLKVNWKWLFTQNWFIFGFYGLTIFLLLLTLFSTPIRGVKSWLKIGNFNFQTSELAKLSLIFLLASFFTKRHFEASRFKNIFISFLFLAVPGGLVLLQPDLGTVLILTGIWGGFLLSSGLKASRILIGLIVFVLIFTISFVFLLKPYQKSRIISFLFPYRDPLGASYNVIQSKVAIGSAGFFGKGFRQGTQVQLGFLPEAQTDFIFSAIIEEWGIIAGIGLILTYLALVWRISRIGLRSFSNQERFLCLGAMIVFSIHFFINVGSSLGLFPVVGTTLPLVSYGGSSLLTNCLLLGIIARLETYF